MKHATLPFFKFKKTFTRSFWRKNVDKPPIYTKKCTKKVKVGFITITSGNTITEICKQKGCKTIVDLYFERCDDEVNDRICRIHCHMIYVQFLLF